MNQYRLEDMIKGWFVGGFIPAAYSTEACEVAVKYYRTGEKEPAHYHKIGTEITLILVGNVRMRDREWNAGDIIVLEPNEVTSFESLNDAITVVVKIPGVLNDKYFIDN